ncbi:DNA binding domain protein, excisionase family [Beutenbergia cavernae DSM 12333]|uniref:DNA binding domain protein, excisionase family n=1 Tax=Beutenbergia cavernae (strain ATCC BAA-8 / DSM 12333 / CCUG 43141 / JCM 11478 / NBRC 16432 / NCIMB 13614 / HKI 0122) TaxID=471853 RepID=C5C2L7_BEUC1|nr:helix-turn-helix domain-containing protein [Beutenbergia cavernae]ACQ79703.1 DNA binding domain protein, excisionase family [Beutenbergia cavernae DSM 12333]
MPIRHADDLPVLLMPLSDARGFSELADALEAAPRLRLATGSGREHELPEEMVELLRTVVETMRRGRDVQVVPVSQRLTTAEVARILGVSRPTVVRLIDDGVLPADRARTHRAVLLADVVTYQRNRRSALDPNKDEVRELFGEFRYGGAIRPSADVRIFEPTGIATSDPEEVTTFDAFDATRSLTKPGIADSAGADKTVADDAA